MKLANRAKPTHTEATLVRSSAGWALAAMSTSGEAHPALDQHEHGQQDDRDGQQPERPRRSPAPHARPRSAAAAGRAGPRPAGSRRAGRTGRARWPAGSVRNSQLPSSETTPAGHADPEQQVVVGVLADQSGQRQAERPADAEHRADQRDAGQRAARRQVTVIRLMPSGTAATDSPVTPRPMISGTRLLAQRADERADDEEAGAHHEHQPLAVQVAQPPDDRHGHGRGQQRRGEQPLGAGRRAVAGPPPSAAAPGSAPTWSGTPSGRRWRRPRG